MQNTVTNLVGSTLCSVLLDFFFYKINQKIVTRLKVNSLFKANLDQIINAKIIKTSVGLH